jgi:thiamine biosynthesis lipoprotein
MSPSSLPSTHSADMGGTEIPRILVRREGRPMATAVSVQIATAADQVAAAEAAAAVCMAWFDEVDQRLSRFRSDSELTRLNTASGRWFAASELLYEVVRVAVSAAEASGGLFDPTMLRELEALGYDRDFACIAQRESPRTDALPRSYASATPAQRAAWRSIAFDPARQRIKLPEGVKIDLGGIAKGWAADMALARYCAPFPGALINVGGDLRSHGGPAPGEPWSVGIRRPSAELAGALDDTSGETTHVAVITFSRGGLATSGSLRRWWLRDGQRQHHLLDPRTGQPMALWIDDRDTAEPGSTSANPLLATATALAPTAARAEVAAKVALLRGNPGALQTVEAAWKRYGAIGPETDADAGVALALTFGNGEIALSQNLSAYLATWGTQDASLAMNVWPPLRQTRPFNTPGRGKGL